MAIGCQHYSNRDPSFLMTDLRQTADMEQQTGEININDYFSNLQSKNLYWGFAATAEFTLTKDNRTRHCL